MSTPKYPRREDVRRGALLPARPTTTRPSSASLPLVSVLLAALVTVAACEPGGSNGPLFGDRTAPWNADRDERSDLPLPDRYAAALDEPDPLVRHMELAEVYAVVGAGDIPALLEVLKKDLRARRAEEIRTFANLLARLDPETALSEVIGWDVPHARMLAQAEVMSVWAAAGQIEKARETWREVAADSPVAVVQQGELGMVEALARHRVLAPMLELLAEAGNEDHRRRMVAKASIVMSQSPGILFSDWAEQVYRTGRLGPELEAELLLQSLKLLLLAGPEPAVAFYERVKDASCAGDALAVIGEKWAQTDPTAALAFMRSRPPEEKTDMGKRAIAIIWLQRDPATAVPYLREAIDGDPAMHPAILPVVQYLMVSDLPGSMTLAQRIPSDPERASALKQGLMRWVQRDPGAVDAYMAAQPVPDDVRQAVQNAKRLRQGGTGA